IRLTNDYFSDSGTIRHRQSTNRSLRRSVASLDRLILRRLRSLPKREIASRRSLWRCCLGGSLGGPSPFIAAASCSRRSGERLSFLFTFLGATALFAAAGFACDFAVELPFFLRAAAARAVDFFF